MNKNFSSIAKKYLDAEKALTSLLEKDGAIDFQELVSQVRIKTDAMDLLEESALDFFEQSGKALESFTKDGKRWIMTPSLRNPGSIQLTYFSSDGLPFGDLQFTDATQAIQEFFRSTNLSSIRNHEGLHFFQYEASFKDSDQKNLPSPSFDIN